MLVFKKKEKYTPSSIWCSLETEFSPLPAEDRNISWAVSKGSVACFLTVSSGPCLQRSLLPSQARTGSEWATYVFRLWWPQKTLLMETMLSVYLLGEETAPEGLLIGTWMWAVPKVHWSDDPAHGLLSSRIILRDGWGSQHHHQEFLLLGERSSEWAGKTNSTAQKKDICKCRKGQDQDAKKHGLEGPCIWEAKS